MPSPTPKAVVWLVLAGPLLWLAAITAAQEPEDRRITGVVEGSGFAKIEIAVPDATGSDLAAIVRADLTHSGFFDVIDPSLYGLVPGPSGGTERHQEWLSIGAEALVRTRVRIAGGQVDLEAYLHDNASGKPLFGRRYAGSEDLSRRVAHQLADDIVLHYTGQKGVAQTRIAFVSQHGEGKEIYLMDYDGQRVRRLTSSGTINLTPAWSPDGNELCFVSWRGRQPAVYVMSSEGKLGELPIVAGELSSAPDWSPDGREIAYSSNGAGNMEIYVLERDRGRNRRLTYSPAIDTSPAFSPNGREIAFTSDRSGQPQIYVMDREGLNVRRVSWSSEYNDSPAWSPRGDALAYASRIDGRFQIVLLDLQTDRVVPLTHGEGHNENPRWSPDGRHLVFASNRAGSYSIYTMRSDGSDVRRLTRGSASLTPDWSR